MSIDHAIILSLIHISMLSDRLALAQRRRFGSSSEKYADGYEQMDLFNEARCV